jgi:hypothetical protein
MHERIIALAGAQTSSPGGGAGNEEKSISNLAIGNYFALIFMKIILLNSL